MLVLFASLALAVATPEAAASWRIEAAPVDDAERALRRCLEGSEARPEARAATVACLVEVSATAPGSVASGLARLDAGLLLLEAGQAREALPHLTHADTARILVRDWALFAEGRAYEDVERPTDAARAYLAAAAEPRSATACRALPRAASALRAVGRPDDAIAALEEAMARCSGSVPKVLSDLAAIHLERGHQKAAAEALDRLDRDYPASAEARAAQTRLQSLKRHLSPETPAAAAERRLARGEALLEAGRTTEAFSTLRGLSTAALPADEADKARVLLARAAIARRQPSVARDALRKVPPGSPLAAEAAYHAARLEARRLDSAEPYRKVADAFPGTPWAEEALLAGGNHFQKDALDEKALPWYRRLVLEHPSGAHVERAAWRVGWGEMQAGRHAEAAQVFERTARLAPPSRWTAAFLYWAGRARLARGQEDRARYLFSETVQRYKYAYHGLRAIEALSHLGATELPSPLIVEATPVADELAAEDLERLRQLLVADHLEGAVEELERLGDSARVRSTLAWVHWRAGRFLDGIVTLKRARPEWISAAGDRLPDEAWRVLYPIRYEDELRRQAASRQLDPALVAGLILQESSFDPRALSSAGARGLMQVMPATGRHIARARGLGFQRASLNDPRTSLDFGTHYLRQVSDRFDGAVEKVLAAYNAGPRRVDTWTALRPGLGSEEFIETIPFTETRQYVMLVLANREQYRRLYGLDRTPVPVPESVRP